MSAGRIDELQSLRGLAALLVAIGHCFEVFGRLEDPWMFAAHVLFNGVASVNLFFVLSGFVLALSFRAKSITPATVTAFYVKRAARIYPGLWTVAVLGLVYVFLIHPLWETYGASDWFTRLYREDRKNLLHIAASFAGISAFLVPPGWSIFIELVGSLLMPPFLWLMRRSRLVFLWLAAVWVVVGVKYLAGPFYDLGVLIPFFMIGASLLAYDSELRRFWSKLGGARILVLAGAIVSFFSVRVFAYDDYPLPIASVFEALAATVIVSAVAQSGIEMAVLRSPLLTRLGDISYSFYLVHFVVLSTFAKFFSLLIRDGQDRLLVSMLLTVVTLAVTWALSVVLYKQVESPGIEMGKAANAWLTKRLTARAATAP